MNMLYTKWHMTYPSTDMYICIYICFIFSKNVPDYSASREKNDLGFVVFDLQTDILFNPKDPEIITGLVHLSI
jgi:hypothetical protein